MIRPTPSHVIHPPTAGIGLLFQISTFVISACVLSLVLPSRWGAALFSRTLLAALCCVFVVPIASLCTQTEKWTWMWVKLAVVLTNLAVHWDRLQCGPVSVSWSLAPLVVYICSANLSTVYGCDVPRRHVVETFLVSSTAYALIAMARSFAVADRGAGGAGSAGGAGDVT